MKSVSDLVKLSSKEKESLKSNFISKLQDQAFRDLASTLDLKDEILMNYTSQLEEASVECKNCKNCKGLHACKNKVIGYKYTPNVVENRLDFSYEECKYKHKDEEEHKYQENIYLFEIIKKVKEASLLDFYKNDKDRAEFLKYVNSFIKDLKDNKAPKGLYLHGSYGTGKTYLIASLFNELAKHDIKSSIVYVPEFIRVLKSSIGQDFDDKYESIKRAPLLLLDDIGAEYLTPWARDEILGTILQYRMDEDLPTFFTSNLTLEELEEHFSNTGSGSEKVKGRRMIERIKDLTIDFKLVGESNRK